jgi:hypothetical protein
MDPTIGVWDILVTMQTTHHIIQKSNKLYFGKIRQAVGFYCVVHTIKTHVKVTIEPLISSLFMIIREV